MPGPHPMSPEDERRCLEFLRKLGVDSPDHRILSDRGYFGLFLSGLSPGEVGEVDHPSIQEFRDTVRLLARAGCERLKFLVAEQTRGIGKPMPEPVKAQAPPDPAPEPAPAHGPPVNATPAPDDPPRVERESDSRPPLPSVTRPGAPKPRAKFQKDIHSVRPPAQARERHRNLAHAGSLEEAVAEAVRLLEKNFYHDAHHVLADYLMEKEVSVGVLTAIKEVIAKASRFDRDRGLAPFNMLWECEETATIVSRRIPEIHKLSPGGDIRTQMLYECAEIVYRMWTSHAYALLEYKFKTGNDVWVRRNWIEPRDFGFLLDIMKTAVRSKLPLDLMRFIYGEIKGCIRIANNVIPHGDKQHRFEGDALRIIASPGKEIIPDLTFEIYSDIVHAYMKEGDTQQAWTFCLQALMIHNNDKEMLRIKEELIEQGASGLRRDAQMKMFHRR